MKFNMEKAYNKGSHLVFDEIAYNPSFCLAVWSNQARSSGSFTLPEFDVYIFSILIRFSLFFTLGFVVNWFNI